MSAENAFHALKEKPKNFYPVDFDEEDAPVAHRDDTLKHTKQKKAGVRGEDEQGGEENKEENKEENVDVQEDADV